MEQKIITEIYNDDFKNFEKYNIPKAQLVIADIPYNIGENAYKSVPSLFIDRDISKERFKEKTKGFFETDYNFDVKNFVKYVVKFVKDEPQEICSAGCIIVFCSFLQQFEIIEEAKKYGFKKFIPLIAIKNNSSQALKAKIKIGIATENAVLLYRNKLPKYRSNGKLVKNWFLFDYENQNHTPRIHPTQKPQKLLTTLIELFTDKGDIVIDPCCGSGSALLASKRLGRHSYGFEIEKKFYEKAKKFIEEETITEKTKQLKLFK